jgi:hypothetical protein
VNWIIALLLAFLGIIILIAIGSALDGVVVAITQSMDEPFRTIFRLPFDFADAIFKSLMPFLR